MPVFRSVVEQEFPEPEVDDKDHESLTLRLVQSARTLGFSVSHVCCLQCLLKHRSHSCFLSLALSDCLPVRLRLLFASGSNCHQTGGTHKQHRELVNLTDMTAGPDPGEHGCIGRLKGNLIPIQSVRAVAESSQRMSHTLSTLDLES